MGIICRLKTRRTGMLRTILQGEMADAVIFQPQRGKQFIR